MIGNFALKNQQQYSMSKKKAKPITVVQQEKKTTPSALVRTSTDLFNMSPILVLAGLLTLTFILYLPALQAGFTNWDDLNYVVNNPFIALNAENMPRLFTENVLGNIHPLTMLSLGIDHAFGGTTNAFPYHLTNILLHLLNTVLVYYLVLHLSNRKQSIAYITALFFAIHPMHVESVAWVSARKDVLYAAFFLGGLLLYIGYLNGQKWLNYGLALLLLILSCMSKPAAVVFPVVLLLLDWFAGRSLSNAKVWVEKIPFFAVVLIAGWITIGAQQEALHKDLYSFGDKLVISAHNFITYLEKAFWWGKLSALYPYPENKTELPGSFYLSVLLFLVLAAAAFWSLRKNKNPFFGFAFYTINIALVLKIVTVGSALIAERYTYIPYIGVFFVVGYAYQHFAAQSTAFRNVGMVVIAAFALTCMAATWQQAGIWKNGLTLFDQAVKNTPSNMAYLNRADQLMLAKQYDKALEDYNKADQLEPMHLLGIKGRGLLLLEMKRYAAALNDFETLEQQGAADTSIYVKKGGCLVNLQRHEEAIKSYDKALALQANYGGAIHDRAAAYFHLKNYPQALADYTKALEWGEAKGTTLVNRGAVYLLLANYAEALRDFDEAIANKADDGSVHYYRSAALNQLGEKEKALEAAGKAQQRGYVLPAGYLERLKK